jgi:hypothetical protein
MLYLFRFYHNTVIQTWYLQTFTDVRNWYYHGKRYRSISSAEQCYRISCFLLAPLYWSRRVNTFCVYYWGHKEVFCDPWLGFYFLRDYSWFVNCPSLWFVIGILYPRPIVKRVIFSVNREWYCWSMFYIFGDMRVWLTCSCTFAWWLQRQRSVIYKRFVTF